MILNEISLIIYNIIPLAKDKYIQINNDINIIGNRRLAIISFFLSARR